VYNCALLADEICALHHDPVAESEAVGNCTDGIDNDCDGMTDTDPECSVSTCAGSAAASTLGANTVRGSSDLVKHLPYFLLPIGAVIGLGIWRRKR